MKKIVQLHKILIIVFVFSSCSNYLSEQENNNNDSLIISSLNIESNLKSNLNNNITKINICKNYNQYVVLSTYQNISFFEDSLNVDLAIMKNNNMEGREDLVFIGFLDSNRKCVRYSCVNRCPFDFLYTCKFRIFTDSTFFKLIPNPHYDSCFYMELFSEKN